MHQIQLGGMGGRRGAGVEGGKASDLRLFEPMVYQDDPPQISNLSLLWQISERYPHILNVIHILQSLHITIYLC